MMVLGPICSARLRVLGVALSGQDESLPARDVSAGAELLHRAGALSVGVPES